MISALTFTSKQARASIDNITYAAIARDLRGYNLMPHRGRRARVARRSRVFGTACAALGGIGVAAAIAALEGRDEAQFAAQRHALEAQLAQDAEQIAAHARLSATAAQHERERTLIRQRAVDRDEFLALLERLASVAELGVVLTELRRRDGETVLSGRARDQQRLATWLDDLRGTQGVVSAHMVSLRRARPAQETADAAFEGGFEFAVRLVYSRAAHPANEHATAIAARRATVPLTVARGRV